MKSLIILKSSRKNAGALKSASVERNKFEDILGVKAWASIQKGRRSGGPSSRIFDNWLNVPVVRTDQVWLDHSHKVRMPALLARAVETL